MHVVHFKSGRTEEVVSIDGGGTFVGSGEYEVHGTKMDGNPFTELQRDILKIVDEDGDQIYWGNPYFPNHPYTPREFKSITKKAERKAGRMVEGDL